jgi:hypothetical protein
MGPRSFDRASPSEILNLKYSIPALRGGQRPPDPATSPFTIHLSEFAIHFNGAATFRSRKCRGTARRAPTWNASMGPRSFARASPSEILNLKYSIPALRGGQRPPDPATSPFTIHLSEFAIRFNGAAIFRSRKCRGTARRAPTWNASMGPRSFARASPSEILNLKYSIPALRGGQRPPDPATSPFTIHHSEFAPRFNGAAIFRSRKPV